MELNNPPAGMQSGGKHSAALFVALLVAWLFWSGHYTPLLIGFGVISCLLTVWLCRRMGSDRCRERSDRRRG